ncbi:MAG: hypothetical protein WBM39_02515 [Parasphingorhabdus sp.]
MVSIFADYLIVASFGAFLGLSELLARYRDEPWLAVINWSGGLYVGINTLASLGALFVINVFEVDFGVDQASSNGLYQLRVSLLIAAGFGAMAIFRSSIFTFRVGDRDLPAGPALILQILLDVADRAVDRKRAFARSKLVADKMKDVDFDKAKLALPTYSMALMQNVTSEEQSAIRTQVDALDASLSGIDKSVSSLILGLLILNVIGEEVLESAVDTLGARIQN